MFGTPGYPHLTILSIQPQQAPRKKLMYTEFWLLYAWAVTLCSHVRYNSNKFLPVSLLTLLCQNSSADIPARISTNRVRSISSLCAIGTAVSSRPCSAPDMFVLRICSLPEKIRRSEGRRHKLQSSHWRLLGLQRISIMSVVRERDDSRAD